MMMMMMIGRARPVVLDDVLDSDVRESRLMTLNCLFLFGRLGGKALFRLSVRALIRSSNLYIYKALRKRWENPGRSGVELSVG